MSTYNETFLETYFDKHFWFDPQCADRRVREVNIRTKRCLGCPGLKLCKNYPEYWLVGLEHREALNQQLAEASAKAE
jgi:hypothetical protein